MTNGVQLRCMAIRPALVRADARPQTRPTSGAGVKIGPRRGSATPPNRTVIRSMARAVTPVTAAATAASAPYEMRSLRSWKADPGGGDGSREVMKPDCQLSDKRVIG